MNISTIQDLVAKQVSARVDELLAKVRPQIEDQIRSALTGGMDKFVAERVAVQLEELRPTAEQSARTEILQKITAYEHLGTVAEPIEIPTPNPLSPSMVNDILSKALDPLTAARGIKKVGKKWLCAFCDMPFKTPRAATMHSRKCDKRAEILQQAISPTKQVVVASSKKRQNGVVKKTKAKKRECIKPNCTNTSKGPRFHYLCGNHKNAPARHVRAWQRRFREAQAE